MSIPHLSLQRWHLVSISVPNPVQKDSGVCHLFQRDMINLLSVYDWTPIGFNLMCKTSIELGLNS